jgi:hypothetical protein
MYFTRQWRSLRKRQLQQQPLCERCASRGRLTPADTVHHKRAHRGDVAARKAAFEAALAERAEREKAWLLSVPVIDYDAICAALERERR